MRGINVLIYNNDFRMAGEREMMHSVIRSGTTLPPSIMIHIRDYKIYITAFIKYSHIYRITVRSRIVY